MSEKFFGYCVKLWYENWKDPSKPIVLSDKAAKVNPNARHKPVFQQIMVMVGTSITLFDTLKLPSQLIKPN